MKNNNKEKHEKAFEAWVNQFEDQIPGTKCMIQKKLATLRYAWGAACEYMSVHHGKLFSYRQMEKKLETAIEALELYSTIENMHIDVEYSGWGSDVEVLEYHNEEHRNFGATAKEALEQIKG